MVIDFANSVLSYLAIALLHLVAVKKHSFKNNSRRPTLKKWAMTYLGVSLPGGFKTWHTDAFCGSQRGNSICTQRLKDLIMLSNGLSSIALAL